MRFRIANPTASLYNNRTQVLAALEFACLDILGQAWGVPGLRHPRRAAARPRAVRVLLLLPLSRPAPAGEVRTIDQVVENARDLKRRFGFTTHKMKAGVFHPDYELECYRALAAAFPGDSFRFDPNAVWSTEQAIRFGQAIEGIRNDYLEDPVYGLNGMRRVAREGARAARHQHGGRELRAARRQRARYRGGRDPARHHVLGRHPRRASKRRASARRFSSAWPCTHRASSASSSRPCCISAP